MPLLTDREFWLLLHIGVGVAFIHGFAGGIATLIDESVTRLRESGFKQRVRAFSTVAMAAAVWFAVVTGTWFVYPGYRATPPDDASTLSYPQAALEEGGATSFWHEFGMEWKEHVGWLAPFLATAVAFVVMRHHRRVTADPRVRRALIALLTVAACASLVAAALGSTINKVAPNLFLDR